VTVLLKNIERSVIAGASGSKFGFKRSNLERIVLCPNLYAAAAKAFDILGLMFGLCPVYAGRAFGPRIIGR
jgi:hypothetical protein